MSGELQVQRLVEARVFVVKGNPDDVVLRFEGSVDTQYFSICAADLQGLSDRFAHDAKLLLVGKDGSAQ